MRKLGYGAVIGLIIAISGCGQSGSSTTADVPPIEVDSTVAQMLEISDCGWEDIALLKCTVSIKQGGGVEMDSLGVQVFDKDGVKIDEGKWPMQMSISPGGKTKAEILVSNDQDKIAKIKLFFP